MSSEINLARARSSTDGPAPDNASVAGSDQDAPTSPGIPAPPTTSAPVNLLASASAADLALMEAFLRFRQQEASNAHATGAAGPRVEETGTRGAEDRRLQPPPPPPGYVTDPTTPQRAREEVVETPPVPRGNPRGGYRGRPSRGRGRGRGRYTPYPQPGGHRCSYHRRVSCMTCASLSHAERTTRILECMVDSIYEFDGRRPSLNQIRAMLANEFR